MRAQKTSSFKRRMRAGFTLVELIVVIGLMALLATISTSGYFAVTRGMAARGSLQDTASIIRFAMQACLIDQVPTAVLFYNFRSDDNNGDCFGRAVVIRMSGRISFIANQGRSVEGGTSSGPMLVDEFADWNQSFPHDGKSDQKSLSFRIYRMMTKNELERGIEKCSSLMCNWVGIADVAKFESEYMFGARMNVDRWCSGHDKKSNTKYSAYENGNHYRWGLPFHPRNQGLAYSEWKIGDAYGTQISEYTLPKNYVYGKQAPKSAKLTPPSSAKALVFYPEDLTSSTAYQFSSVDTVEIYMLNDVEGKSVSLVGKVDREALKDQDD